MTRGLIFALIALCSRSAAVYADAPPARPPTSVPAATEPAEPDVAGLIENLGNPDPGIRENAGKTLWARGRSVSGALAAAANSDNPEVSRRARAILRDFTYGIYPDAPREIFSLLDEYHKGDPQEKNITVFKLGGQGVAGLRVLIKLREEERDPNLKQLISQVLAPREHEVAVLMLADGQAAELEHILESSAFDSDNAAEDYAALLFGNGRLAQKLAELKAAPSTPRTAAVVVALARAAGDNAGARTAAVQTNRPELIDAVLTEQGDWAELARRLTADPHGLEPVERLGYLCAYHRLAGNKDDFDRTARELIALASHAPQDYQHCAENLFLNGRTDDAVNVLLGHKDFAQAINFLGARLDFRRALDLPGQSSLQQPGEAIRIKARTVASLQFIGEIDRAKKLMVATAVENGVRNDFATWVYLVQGARLLGMRQQADVYAAAALEKATAQEPIGWMFEKMGFGDGTTARLWWPYFRAQHPAESAGEALGRLRAVFDGDLPDAELESLADSARRWSIDSPDREAWERNLIDTLERAGHIDTASKWTGQIAQTSVDPVMLIYAGDFEARRKNWRAAAADYQKAWERDHTSAVARFLHGWAVQQDGREAEGRALMESAHRLPLGSETGRHDLLEALRRHKLTEDASVEADLIRKITVTRSWDRSDALRTTAEDLAKKGDYLGAADAWERAFLPNLSTNTTFLDPWANVIVPALIHKTRALGLIAAGRIPAANEEADRCLEEAPGDADALIDIVNALDKAGHAGEAQAFFAAHTAVFRTLILTYPNSGPGYNQLAWSQVMCNRELDDALKNAQRSVELEPTSTASIDTLAEVYFARHQAAEAIAQMKRCIELEPRVERHRRQLARFEGKPGATTRPED